MGTNQRRSGKTRYLFAAEEFDRDPHRRHQRRRISVGKWNPSLALRLRAAAITPYLTNAAFGKQPPGCRNRESLSDPYRPFPRTGGLDSGNIGGRFLQQR